MNIQEDQLLESHAEEFTNAELMKVLSETEDSCEETESIEKTKTFTSAKLDEGFDYMQTRL